MNRVKELFLGTIRYRWFEYLLGALIVACVTTVLVAQRSITTQSETQVHDLAHKFGKNMLVIPADADLENFHNFAFGSASMPDDYPDQLRQSPLAKNIRLAYARLAVNVEIGDTPAVLVGSNNFRGVRFSRSSEKPEIWLGPDTADALRASPGQDIDILGTVAKVSGIVDTAPDGIEMGIFAPLAFVQMISSRPNEINAMRLMGCWCSIDVPTLGAKVEELLPNTRAITVAGVLQAQQGSIATVKRYSGILHWAAALLIGATILLLINSQVRRSSKEIGLLSAMGVPFRYSQSVFVLSAIWVGAVGAIIGSVAGIPLVNRMDWSSLPLLLKPPPNQEMFIIVALSASLSVIGAIYPIWRISRIDPVDALREE